jgi:hypothetical protein
MPKKYAQIVLAIETLLDFEDLSVKVTGRQHRTARRRTAPDRRRSATGFTRCFTASTTSRRCATRSCAPGSWTRVARRWRSTRAC